MFPESKSLDNPQVRASLSTRQSSSLTSKCQQFDSSTTITMVLKIASIVIASAALLSAVGMISSVKQVRKLPSQSAGNSKQPTNLDDNKVVPELIHSIEMPKEKQLLRNQKPTILGSQEKDIQVLAKSRRISDLKPSERNPAKNTEISSEFTSKTFVNDKKTKQTNLDSATKAILTDSHKHHSGEIDIQRTEREKMKAGNTAIAAQRRQSPQTASLKSSLFPTVKVRTSRKLNRRNKKIRDSKRISKRALRNLNTRSVKKLARKKAKNLAKTVMRLPTKTRQTQLPFLSSKTRLHYEYSTKWPATCPCERAAGLLKGTCWYFTGVGTNCRKRNCRPAYICVVGARTALTCFRKALRERIVPNNDGTCRTEFIKGYMYKPYSSGSYRNPTGTSLTISNI